MSQVVSLSTLEILLTIVHYTVVISFLIMIGQIIWTLFSVYREKESVHINEDDEHDKSTIESE
jgi:hypothetical protein